MTRQIVILGASYAGLTVAHRLLKETLPKVPDIKVLLVSPSEYMYWNMSSIRAMVPGQVEIDDLFAPIAPGFEKYPESAFRFVKGIAVPAGLNKDAKTVRIKHDGSGHLIDEPYEFIVVATGTSAPGPDMPWKAGVWSYHDLRNMLHENRENISRANIIVIGGGGPTGVELAGELAAANGHINGITLLTSSKKLLPKMAHPSISKDAEDKLTTMGANVVLGWPISVTRELHDGSQLLFSMECPDKIDRYACNLYLPAIGNTPNSCILQSELFENRTGLARVDEYLRIEGTEDIWAAGDISNAEPALCVNAVRQGLWVAKNLDRVLRNKEPKAYHRNKRSKITISLGREKVECPNYNDRTFLGVCSKVYSKVCSKLLGRSRETPDLKIPNPQAFVNGTIFEKCNPIPRMSRGRM